MSDCTNCGKCKDKCGCSKPNGQGPVYAFPMGSFVWTDPAISCSGNTIIETGDSFALGFANLVAYVCALQLIPGPQGPAGADGPQGPPGIDGLDELLIQNTLIVSMNGNDITGARNDWAKPFLTITAANLAAQANDLIIIFPGSYNLGGSAFNKNDVSYYVYKGAIIQGSGNLIMDGGQPMNINIYGEGTFVSTGARALFIINPNTNLHFKFDSAVGLLDGIAIGDANKIYIRGKYTAATIQYAVTIRGNCEGIMDIDIYDGSTSQGADTVLFRNHSLDEVPRNFKIKGKILSNTTIFEGALAMESSPGLSLDAEECHIIHDTGSPNGSISAVFHASGKLKFGGRIQSLTSVGITVVNSGADPSILLLKGALVNSEFTALNIGSDNTYVEVDGCDLTKGPNQAGSAVLLGPVVNNSELDIRNSLICNQSEASGDHGIGSADAASIIRLDNVKIVLNPLTAAYSVASAAVRTVNFESVFSSNAVLDPNVTNAITGSLIVIDSAIGKNNLKFN